MLVLSGILFKVLLWVLAIIGGGVLFIILLAWLDCTRWWRKK